MVAAEHQSQNEEAETVDYLSQPVQALLQVLDAIQPASKWEMDPDEQNKVVFQTIVVPYNPIKSQAQQFCLYLSHPASLDITDKFVIRPPRLQAL